MTALKQVKSCFWINFKAALKDVMPVQAGIGRGFVAEIIQYRCSIWLSLIRSWDCLSACGLASESSSGSSIGLSLCGNDAFFHVFMVRFQRPSCDKRQTQTFLCVFDLGGRSIVFCLLFSHLSPTARTKLVLFPLGHFVWECSTNYLALIFNLISLKLGRRNFSSFCFI